MQALSSAICGHDPKAKGLGKEISCEGSLSVREEWGLKFFSKQGGEGKQYFLLVKGSHNFFSNRGKFEL